MRRLIPNLAILSMAVFALSACSDKEENTPDKNYRVGDLYDNGGVKGLVYKATGDGQHGMIVSLDETKAQWSTVQVKTAAIEEDDGEKNQVAIEAVDGWQTAYPAFAWCADKNKRGVSGWFLPAYSQLLELYEVWNTDQSGFNKVLIDNGGIPFVSTVDGEYWSSSEDVTDANCAAAKKFDREFYSIEEKTLVFKVRAVNRF